MSSYIKADMKGLENLVRKLKTKIYVDVGILEGTKHPDGNETIASIGAKNELGTDKAGRNGGAPIPARSFIKMPLEEKSKEITLDVEKTFAENFKKGDFEKIMATIGVACEKQIQLAFESGGFGTWEENAQSTIDAKGSSSPLIDIGLLRKSISYKVGK